MTSALSRERARSARLESAFLALARDYEELVNFTVADFARGVCLARLERHREAIREPVRLRRRA